MYDNGARVGDTYASYAMKQEIAAKAGNFCGVCPVIGRLNCPVRASVYRWGLAKVGLRRPFFLAKE